MNNLKTFIASVWACIVTKVRKTANLVVDFDSFRQECRDILKARECLFRTRTAYHILTGFPVRDLVTAYTVDSLARRCDNYEELAVELDETGAGDDEIYCILLLIAFGQVYKSNEPPTIGGNIRPRLK